jgi:hypothetical protein
MGLSYGQSSGQTSSTATSSGTGTQQNVYSPGQTAVRDQTGTTLASDLAAANAGTLSPGVKAMETNAADQINKTSSGLTDRVNQFLAQRGFGKSGQTGKATLEGELGRESQLGTNAATFAGQQSQLNTQNLLAALNYAFTSLGSNVTQAGTTSGSGTSSGSNFGASISGKDILGGIALGA